MCHDFILISVFVSGFRISGMQKKIHNMVHHKVRIGGASGFWGDSMVGAVQLVDSGQIDYLVFDYLAETTMAIMVGMRAKKPELGYATDFVDVAMKSVLPKVLAQGIKVVSNAGGVNPKGCAKALRDLADSFGVKLKIAVVEGDDVSSVFASVREEGVCNMFTGAALPERVLSANAYLGGFPIAKALAMGADVVITGRGVDSAVTLGPLIHEFGWSVNDFDALASGSLAGHIIECGCQATGGLFTDWQDVPDWHNMGYPIVECSANGDFDVFKPQGTGGLISCASVAEQMLYEIGDPACYKLADVICDFSQVRIEQISTERVRVAGAKGSPPPHQYKVSATTMNGYRCSGALVIIGIDAVAKAERTAKAVIDRCHGIFSRLGLAPFSEHSISLLGAETLYGAHALTSATREVWLRINVRHTHKAALEIFAKEIAPAGTSWAQGTTGPALARPTVSPAIEQLSFLIDKDKVSARLSIDDVLVEFEQGSPKASSVAAPSPVVPTVWSHRGEEMIEVPLIKVAWARSGDKGDISNIGVIARKPEWMPLLWAALTPDAIGKYFAHLVKGKVERFYLPGIAAMNIVMHEALDGGGPSSSRMDPLGKGIGQILLSMPIKVPKEWL
jgi:Acyclic terpene utilisation family protein AtuA